MRQGPAHVARVPVQTSQSRTLTWHELVGGCCSTAGKMLASGIRGTPSFPRASQAGVARWMIVQIVHFLWVLERVVLSDIWRLRWYGLHRHCLSGLQARSRSRMKSEFCNGVAAMALVKESILP